MIASVNFQFPLTGNGVYVSSGRTETLTMSKSQTTTNPQWLHNSHAGELLVSEFMEPLGLTAEALAAPLGVEATRLSDVINGRRPIDADLDLRLSRYFRMSEGFFLGLQLDHDLLAAKRALNGDLDRIIPLAA
jgi:antitoxin HigA-1